MKINIKKYLIPHPINKEKPDYLFMALVFILLSVGLIMLFSASYPYGLQYRNDSAYFIKRQALFAAVGIVMMLAISFINYRFYSRYAYLMYSIALIMLFCVRFVPLSMFRALSGAHRWIIIGPISFQPSEIAKFVIICVIGRMAITIGKNKLKSFSNGVLMLAIPTGAMAILIMIEPHISGTIIFCVIAFACMLVSGIDRRWAIAAIIIITSIIVFIYLFPNLLNYIAKYGGSRVKVWRNPFAYSRTTGYQTVQSLYSISSGGIWGTGIGQSRAKHLFLPEPYNDYIFAICCEELGLIGAILIIAMFVLLVWRGMKIAKNTKDKFGRILATGISTQIGIQVFLNTAVVTNLIPSTGISLPFFSYGGTSLLMLLCEMGVMLSISRVKPERDRKDISL